MAQVANPLDATTDTCGLAPHRNYCPHVNSAIDIPSNWPFDDTTCSVPDCQETECWFCLKSHKVLCGRYGNQHMMMHYAENPSNCIAMGLNDLSFWCYQCGDYINHLSIEKVWNCYTAAHLARFGEPVPPQLLSKTTFKKSKAKKNGVNTVSVIMESVPESDPIADDEVDDEIKIDSEPMTDSNTNHLNEEEKKQEIKDPKEIEIESESKENDQSAIEEIDSLLSNMNLNESSELESHCKTALFYHKDCLLHKPGNNRSHVERPERCSRSYQMLKQYGLLSYLMAITAREATEEELKGSHKASHVERTMELEHHGWLDSDTFFNKHSSRAAKLAAGATIDVMAGILEGKFENGFALVRPPGHHCEHGKAMGFCLFNNAVVAVNEIRRRGLCKKALIIDWDVHHGNGTQNMFYDDEDVLYFSTHRSDEGYFYPGTGFAKETGKGFNVNVPLNVNVPVRDELLEKDGHGDAQYLLIWKDILLPMVREFKPDIILISAGFDACIGDPLGGMLITPPCYGLMTRLLLNECSNLAIVLEGGYNLETMPRAIVCCHYALLKGPKKQKNAYDVGEFYEEFKQNIIDDGSNGKDHEPFHLWFEKYGDTLRVQEAFVSGKMYVDEEDKDGEEAVHKSCKETVKEVLVQHEDYWKFIGDKLKEYGVIEEVEVTSLNEEQE